MILDSIICDKIVDFCKKSNDKIQYNEADLLVNGDRPFFSPWRYIDNRSIDIEKMIWKSYISPNLTNKSTNRTSYKMKELIGFIPIDFITSWKIDVSTNVVGVFNMSPGNFTIPHYDLYGNYKGDRTNIRRLWISLSKPAFGHILWIDGEKPYTMIKQGMVIEISGTNRLEDRLHVGANLGYEDRWFMTITGRCL